MKKLLHAVLLTTVVAFAALLPDRQAHASHYMGSDVTFTYTGTPGMYLVRLQAYRDCNPTSINFPTTSITMQGTSSCGNTPPFQVFLNDISEASEVCAGQTTECSSPPNLAVPGVEVWTYEGFVTIANCADWKFSWASGTRNPGIVNIQNSSNQNWYTEATLNTSNGIINNSPRFGASPVPYVCHLDTISLNPQVYDPDGDSLVYTLIAARSSVNTSVPYQPTYTFLQPFGTPASIPANNFPASLNPATGQLTFMAMLQSAYVLVVKVQEFRNINGVPTEIGSILRDVQVTVVPCTTPRPTMSNTVTINRNGVISTANINSLIEVDACVPVCIDITANTTAPTNIWLNMRTNALNEVPNSTFTVIGQDTQNPVGRLCFTPSPNLVGQNFSFTVGVLDNACPFPNQIIRAISLKVNKYTGYTTSGAPTTICAGTPVQLSSAALPNMLPLSNPAYTSFEWTAVHPVTGQPIPGQFQGGANTSTNLNPLVYPTQTARYVLTSPTTFGCTDTASVLVTVTGVQPNIQAINTPNTTLCLSQSAQLISVVQGPSFVPNPAWTYSWTPATGLSSTTMANPVVTFDGLNTVTYTLTVSNGTCSDTETITINFVPDAIVSATPSPASLCIGQPVQLTGTSNTAGSTFSWIAGDRIDSPGTAATSAMPATLGTSTYILQVTTGLGCTINDTVNINVTGVLPVIDTIAAAATTLCTGDVVQLNGMVSYDQIVTPAPAFTYQWTPNTHLSASNIPNPFVTGSGLNETITYTLTVTNGSCTDTETITINFVPEIFLATSANPQAVCVGDTVDLMTLVTPGSVTGVNFTWTGRGINAVNAANTYAIPDTTGALQYTVVAELGAGCTKTETVTINVSGVRPRITSLSANPAAICFGQTSALSATVESSIASIPNPGFSFAWTPASQIQGDSVGLTAIAEPDVTTMYYFNANDNGSCTVIDSIEVLVGAEVLPAMTLTYSQDSLALPPTDVTFTNTTATIGPIDSVHWVITNLDLPNNPTVHLMGNSPTHTFNDPNQYSVTMTVYAPYGCVYQLTRRFRVGGLRVPNIITPNGDGVNDEFVLPALRAGGKVQVFNRWGKRMKEFGPGGSWAPGSDVPSGVYFYVIEEVNPSETFKGWIEVVR